MQIFIRENDSEKFKREREGVGNTVPGPEEVGEVEFISQYS